MPLEVQGTFVSQKINKIRWIPEDYVETKCFFTGSWDDRENSIKVWSYESPSDEDEIDYPHQLSEYRVDGDVTEIKYVEKYRIAVPTSNGDVRLLEISAYEKDAPLREIYLWKSLHNFGSSICSCTSLDVLDGEVATVGEDGNINLLNCRRGEVSRTIKSADSCSLHSVCFIKHSEIITGNVRGHMKLWDIRTPSDKPSASFLLSGDEQAAMCLVHHPTQPHIVLAGSESGSLAIWDLRINTYPNTLLSAHASGVTEIQFHPDNPQKLLTCSLSGEIWDWNMESMTKSLKNPANQSITWLPLQDKSNIPVNSLMSPIHKPINSLHCDRGRILCSADNEAVYLIKNYKY